MLLRQQQGVQQAQDMLQLLTTLTRSCALQTVRVCMIDTGTDLTHPDIMSNLWVNQAELNGKPGVDDDNNGEHAIPCWASLCR